MAMLFRAMYLAVNGLREYQHELMFVASPHKRRVTASFTLSQQSS